MEKSARMFQELFEKGVNNSRVQRPAVAAAYRFTARTRTSITRTMKAAGDAQICEVC